MNRLFSGRKKFLTILLASILGIIFLPLTILFVLAWLVHSRVKNQSVKILSYSFLAFLVIPLALSYFSPSTYPVDSVSEQPEPSSVNVSTKKQEGVFPEPEPVLTAQPQPSNIRVESNSEPVLTHSLKLEDPLPVAATLFDGSAPSNDEYVCDCSKSCKEISSCKEALFQLKECGCSKRDGDNDGVACDGSPLNCQR